MATEWRGTFAKRDRSLNSHAHRRLRSELIGLARSAPSAGGSPAGRKRKPRTRSSLEISPSAPSPRLAGEFGACQNRQWLRCSSAECEEALMAQVTIAPPNIKTLADLLKRLGD